MPAFDVDAISLDDLRQRRSAKWRQYDPDVLPTWIAEMDFPLAEPIARELRAAIDASDTGYMAAAELPDALAAFARERWGWEVSPDRIVPAPDVLTGLAQAIERLTAPGDGVVINPPVYPPFFSTVRDVTRRRVVEVPMARATDGRFDWDVHGLELAFAQPDVTAFVMSSPHNPTGTVPDRSTLAAIAALAKEHDVAVIADEIHAPLVLTGAEHVPYLTIAEDDANAVALVSASKAWNLPGLKCSQLVGSGRTHETVLSQLPLEVVYGTGHFGVLATLAAYREGGPWLDHVRAILEDNRRLLADLLATKVPTADYRPPEASYLAWLDFTGSGLGPDPAQQLLDGGRVALNSGLAFGREGSGFARLNFGTSPAILGEIVRRIASVVQ